MNFSKNWPEANILKAINDREAEAEIPKFQSRIYNIKHPFWLMCW